jgi:hypothetical protein
VLGDDAKLSVRNAACSGAILIKNKVKEQSLLEWGFQEQGERSVLCMEEPTTRRHRR